jgi:hypothetical protein
VERQHSATAPGHRTRPQHSPVPLYPPAPPRTPSQPAVRQPATHDPPRPSPALVPRELLRALACSPHPPLVVPVPVTLSLRGRVGAPCMGASAPAYRVPLDACPSPDDMLQARWLPRRCPNAAVCMHAHAHALPVHVHVPLHGPSTYLSCIWPSVPCIDSSSGRPRPSCLPTEPCRRSQAHSTRNHHTTSPRLRPSVGPLHPWPEQPCKPVVVRSAFHLATLSSHR